MDELQLQQIAAQLRMPHGEEGIGTAEWMNKGNRHMYTHAMPLLDVTPSDTILEIGMGNGLFVGEILEMNESVSYTGCDLSELMVTEAVRINAEWIAKGRAKFICGDAESLPLADSTFNKVMTVNTIYFWENQSKILNEIKRVLQPNGLLIIVLRPKHYTEKYPFVKYGFNQFSKEDLATLLQQNEWIVNAIHENAEPEMQMNDEKMEMGNLIIIAQKR